MSNIDPNLAERVAWAAIEFEEQRTGRSPSSITAIMNNDTLVITLRPGLTPMEQILARRPEGAAQLQEFHQQVFNESGGFLRQQIKEITGAEVQESTVQIDPGTGGSVRAFISGTVVQVFLLDGSVPASAWTGNPRDREK